MLTLALEEAEESLEQEGNRTIRAQGALSEARQEIDRKVMEKEEEFKNVRKTQQRLIESMQVSSSNL